MNTIHLETILRALDENPEDDTPLLVYADWLDENGDEARAALIRLQCERERLDPDDPRATDLHQREQQIVAEHKQKWVPAFAASRQDVYTQFARGLFDYVGGALTDDDLRALAGQAALRSLILEGAGITDAGMPHLLALPR